MGPLPIAGFSSDAASSALSGIGFISGYAAKSSTMMNEEITNKQVKNTLK